MNDIIQFFVPGAPKTAGSKRAFFRPGMKFPIITDDCKTGKDWRGDVKRFATEAFSGPPLEGPLKLILGFVMPRPKGHSGKKGLKASAPTWHTSKPDVLKMARAVEDALTGIIWRDDSQIASEVLMKTYGERIGVNITILVLEEQPATRSQVAQEALAI